MDKLVKVVRISCPNSKYDTKLCNATSARTSRVLSDGSPHCKHSGQCSGGAQLGCHAKLGGSHRPTAQRVQQAQCQSEQRESARLVRCAQTGGNVGQQSCDAQRHLYPMIASLKLLELSNEL